jgi:hypothetical protein
LALGSRSSTRDEPWGENPFPEGTPKHQSWTEMNLWTKEHLALLQAEMLKNRPPDEASPKEYLDHVLKALAGAFDIWARAASRNVILTDQAADLFEQILNEFEPAMASMASGFPPTLLPEGLYTTEVKRVLQQRKQYWIGRMLRKVRKRKEANSAKAASNTSTGADLSEAEPQKLPRPSADRTEPGIPSSRRAEAVREPGGAESVDERAERRSAVVMPILMSTPAREDLDFTSNEGRSAAVGKYAKHWTCSEAALARAAAVDTADLSKWKKGQLPAGSEKRARVERALVNNQKPVLVAKRSHSDS